MPQLNCKLPSSVLDDYYFRFYKKNLSDERIKNVFAKTDMSKLKDHQRNFLTYAFGGPNNYTGRRCVATALCVWMSSILCSMRAAHEGYNITELQFDAVVENLTNTLKELGKCDEFNLSCYTPLAAQVLVRIR